MTPTTLGVMTPMKAEDIFVTYFRPPGEGCAWAVRCSTCGPVGELTTWLAAAEQLGEGHLRRHAEGKVL